MNSDQATSPHAQAPHPGGWRPRLSGWLARSGTLGALSLIAASLLIWTASWFWVGEVAASFSWHLGLAGSAGALLLALVRRPRLALLAFLLSASHLWPELSLWLPNGSADHSTVDREELTIASCNLLWTNLKHEGLHEWLDDVDPDIVAFQEVSPDWRIVLEKLSDRYPHLFLSPLEEDWNRGTWGTAVLSRIPLTETRLIAPPENVYKPMIEVVTTLGGKPLTLRTAHPIRPGKSWRIERRNAVLNILAHEDWSGQSMLLGDLNVTSTSPAFSSLLQNSGLHDSRAGFGRQPSYTTPVPLCNLSVAIDHVLVSDAIHVLERRTEALAGSDHLSVVVKVTAVE